MEEVMKRFGIRDKIGYMLGDFGNDFFFIMISSFLLVFYTDVLKINPAWVGVLFIIARIWDAFMDVIWGVFIDSRAVTRQGKFRPWILRMSLPLVVFGILVFTKIPGVSSNVNMIFCFVTYILWGTLYSTVNIPYGSLASVISGDPIERSSLSIFRTLGATISGLIVSIAIPLVAFVNQKADGTRFFISACVFAAFSFIGYLLCYKMTTERILIESDPKDRIHFGTTLKALGKNRPFLSLVCASVFLAITILFMSSMNAYLFKDYFHNIKILSLATMASIIPLCLVMPFMGPLTKRFGKKEVISVGILVSAIINFILFLLPISNAYLFIAMAMIAGLGIGSFNAAIWAFVTDVIDYQEFLTGKRSEGTVYSIYSFGRKVGQAIAGGIGAFSLILIGYNANVSVQTKQVSTGIKNVATLVPAIAFFIIFLLITFAYPLTKEKVIQLSQELGAKRKSQMSEGQRVES
jgi:GPH family glycoside/pentoside/hexuronide:cation symporter